MAIFAMSLDLLVGYTGLVSLGHAAFFGLAGYTLALVSPQYEAASLWTSLPLAIGVPRPRSRSPSARSVLRTSGIYFIMVTLAFAQMLLLRVPRHQDRRRLRRHLHLRAAGRRPVRLAAVLLENVAHFYFVMLALRRRCSWLLRVVLRSPFGRVIAGIRVNEHRMRSLGYATFRYKLACFVIAGALAGIAGYLAAAQYGIVNPDMMGWHLSGSG